VKLFDGKAGRVDSVSVASIEANGSLMVLTADGGASVESFWGDDDYEYWVTVAPKDKDSVILALMAKCYEGDAEVVAHFKELLKSKGIPFQFDSWI